MINILEWILAIVLLVTFILLCIWVFSGFNRKSRFTPVSRHLLKDIARLLHIEDGSVLYDLSSGDGRLLFYLLESKPNATYIGIENNKLLLFISRIQNKRNKIKGKKRVQIMNKDFFDQDLSNATHIFTYLYPNIMDDLLPKLDEELKTGSHLISLNFKFTTKAPIQEFEVQDNSNKVKNKIYVYEF